MNKRVEWRKWKNEGLNNHVRQGAPMRLSKRLYRAGKILTLAVALYSCVAAPLPAQTGKQKPKVRAVTAFVRLDRADYRAQVADALKFLRRTKAIIEQGGYEVETIRIVTQPFPEYTKGLSRPEALQFFRAFGELAAKEDVDPNIGPAMLRDADDPAQAELLAEILCATRLSASLVIAGEDGVHWNAIRAAAKLVKYVAEHSPHSLGTFNFAATAMVAPYTPFYPGAYHTGAGKQFALGFEAANVVDEAFSVAPGDARAAAAQLTKALGQHAAAVEKLARAAEKETGWTYMGLDATPAPLKDVSIGAAIEKFTGARFGSSGTLTAASIITAAVKAVPVKQVGYNGLMLPVLEDSRIAQRWSEGAVSVDALLAYSAVCGTGLDTIPLPGDVTLAQLERMLGDVAALAVRWKKPLAARLQPVAGKKAGEKTEFDDPFLVNALIQKLP
jgi:uncharacterized protein (UPF0210 family)